MGEWIQVDPERSKTLQPKKVKGVEIHLVMSPFDVPQLVRGRKDDELKRFLIEFNYQTNEPHRREEIDEFVCLRIGRQTGRLLGIEVDVDKMKVESVGLRVRVPQQVEAAIDQAATRLMGVAPRFRPAIRDNFEAAKQALSQAKEHIYATL